MKSKLLLTTSLLLAAFGISAQKLSPTVISSGGGFGTSGGYTLSYTVGEMSAVQTLSAGGTILTQGFQQPNDAVLGLLELEHQADGTFSLYPNPVQHILWFGYEFSEKGKIEISLYDLLGQKLEYGFEEHYESGKVVHTLDCTAYAAGHYILSVKYNSVSGYSNTISKKFQVIN